MSIDEKKKSHSQDIFDGLCSALSTLLGIIGVIFTGLQGEIMDYFMYIAVLIFWVIWLVFSLIFSILVYMSRRRIKKDLERVREENRD